MTWQASIATGAPAIASAMSTARTRFPTRSSIAAIPPAFVRRGSRGHSCRGRAGDRGAGGPLLAVDHLALHGVEVSVELLHAREDGGQVRRLDDLEYLLHLRLRVHQHDPPGPPGHDFLR